MDLHRHLATGAALLLFVPLAGCGEKTINSEDLEAKTKSELGKDVGVEPKSVSCPDDIEVKKGKTFQCDVVLPDGREGTTTITLTNDEGSFTATRPVPKGG